MAHLKKDLIRVDDGAVEEEDVAGRGQDKVSNDDPDEDRC